MRFNRRFDDFVLALGVGGCVSTGCSGHVADQPQTTMSGTSGSKGTGSSPNGSQIPDASGALDCGGIPVPGTGMQLEITPWFADYVKMP